MTDINTKFAPGTTDAGVTFEQAMEVHRLFQEDFLTAAQIARYTGIGEKLVGGILTGRHFPGAAKHWERKQ